MNNSKIARLFGFDASAISFNRIAALFCALFFADFITNLLINPYVKLFYADAAETQVLWISPLEIISNSYFWFDTVFANLLLVGLAVIIFRFVPNGYLACLILAVTFAFSESICAGVFYPLISEKSVFGDFFKLQFFFIEFCLVLVKFICLELALNIFTNLPLALFTGSLISVPIRQILIQFIIAIADDKAITLLSFRIIPLQLFTSAIFALILTAWLKGKYNPDSINAQSGLPAPARSWKIHPGGLWSGYKILGGNTAQLAKPGGLNSYYDGRMELAVRYDPPGSLFLGFLVAFVSYIIYAVMVLKVGFGGFIGWMPWYVLITMTRRQNKTINLQTAENIIVDIPQRRVGFLSDFEGKKQWMAFEVEDNFEEVLQNLRAMKPYSISEGIIERRTKPVTILAIIALVILVFAIFAAFALFSSASGTRR